MKKLIFIFMFFILLTPLFADYQNNWIGVSFMGDIQTTISGSGMGGSFSLYSFFDSKEEKALKAPKAAASIEKKETSLFSPREVSLFAATPQKNESKQDTASKQPDIKRNKIGLMAQVNILGEFPGDFGDNASATFNYYTIGMGIRQIINKKLTIYEGVGLGIMHGSGSATRQIRGTKQYYDDSLKDFVNETVYGTQDVEIYALGFGLTLDAGVKYDIMPNFSILGGITMPILFGDISSSYINEPQYDSNGSNGSYVNWDSNYYDYYGSSMVIAFQPYIGLSYNF